MIKVRYINVKCRGLEKEVIGEYGILVKYLIERLGIEEYLKMHEYIIKEVKNFFNNKK